jgi:hypothetical protein
VVTTRTETAADEVAAQLYALPPERFTTARNAWAKQARQRGDRAPSAAIGRLAKPTMAGWLVNQMAQEYPQEIGTGPPRRCEARRRRPLRH